MRSNLSHTDQQRVRRAKIPRDSFVGILRENEYFREEGLHACYVGRIGWRQVWWQAHPRWCIILLPIGTMLAYLWSKIAPPLPPSVSLVHKCHHHLSIDMNNVFYAQPNYIFLHTLRRQIYRVKRTHLVTLMMTSCMFGTLDRGKNVSRRRNPT